MSILKIARMGHPILLERSKTLNSSEIASNLELQKLIDDMVETLKDSGGVGLAGPQVYADKRVILAMAPQSDDTSDGNTEFTVLINPELEFRDKEQELGWEGCLSIPDQFAEVTRPKQVQVRWMDLNGAEQTQEFDGLWSTCVQHEIDHLDGKLFIDYLGAMKRQMITRKMQKLKREIARGKEV